MPIFPVLEFDEKVQVNDKIRISAAKSFVSSGTTALTRLSIKPYDNCTGNITGIAATDIITHYGHNFVAGDTVVFTSLTGGAGLSINTTYYIVATVVAGVSYKVSATSGGTAIDFSSNITAGVATQYFSVYSSTVADRFLDWSYSDFSMDIDSTNNTIDFKEGSTEYEATLTSGSYTLSTLAAEIKTAMDAVGDRTYTVTVSDNDELTISATGTFSLVPSADNILKQLGFSVTTTASLANGTTFTGKRIRYLTRRISLLAHNGYESSTVYGYVKLYSVDGDNLFSNDSDLTKHEPDLLNWLPDGKNSYKYAHRRAQELILKYLDEKGYTDVYDDKLLIDAIVDIDEVKEWSTFLTLKLIFQGMKNAVDDVFSQKVQTYLEYEKQARDRAVLRIDLDNDGEIDKNSTEVIFTSTIDCARR